MTASLVLLVANEQEGCNDNPRTETLLTQVAVRADIKLLLAARMNFAVPSLLGIGKRAAPFRQRFKERDEFDGWKNWSSNLLLHPKC